MLGRSLTVIVLILQTIVGGAFEGIKQHDIESIIHTLQDTRQE